MINFRTLVPFATILTGCSTTPDKALSPCEQWKAAVQTCATQAGTQLDSGLLGDTALSPEALGATARCSANSGDDPDWMQELYTCYTRVYDNIDCSTTEGLLDISVQIADCGIMNGGA